MTRRPVTAVAARIVALALALALALGTAACSADDPDAATADDPEAATADGAGESGPPVEVTAPSVDELLGRDEALLIAHAGGNLDAPAETLYAYHRAVAAGSDVLELDVRSTADGALVVHHDETVDRLTDGTGTVADMTLEEVQALDAAHWFVPGCTSSCRDRPAADYPFRGARTGEAEPPGDCSPEDFRVPTFAEVATTFPDLPLDVEVKDTGAQGEATVDALASELERLDRVDSTVVVSFDDAVVDRMRERLPEVAVSPGLDRLTEWVASDEPLGDYAAIQIPPTYQGIDLLDLLVPRAEDEGLAVWVWPTDEATQETTTYYRHLIELGIDGVIAASPAHWPPDA